MDLNKSMVDKSRLETMNHEFELIMWPVILFMVILLLTGLIGNSLVIAVFSTKRNVTSTNLSMLALAIVDLLSCSIIHPYIIYKLTHQFNQDWIITCKILEFFNHASLAVSMGMLFSIAYDRYMAVCKPYIFNHSFNTFKSLLIASVVHGVVISSPLLYFYGKRSQYTHYKDLVSWTHHCDFSDAHRGSMPEKIFGLIVLCAFIGLVASISVIYFKVATLIYKSNKIRPSRDVPNLSRIASRSLSSGDGGTQLDSRQICQVCKISNIRSAQTVGAPDNLPIAVLNPVQTSTVGAPDNLPIAVLNPVQTSTLPSGPPPFKCAKMLFMVTAVFLVSWLPFWVLRITDVIQPGFWSKKSQHEIVFEKFLTHLIYINNAINPFIYAVMNKRFRADLAICVRKINRSCAAVH